MATYSVKTRRYGTQTGIANTADVVLLFPALLRQLNQRFNGWVRATRSSDAFTFYSASDVELGTITLTRVDIRHTVSGCEVLFEATTDRWEACRVVDDGDKVVANGIVYSGTTRAALITTSPAQDVSGLTGIFLETGTDEDADHVWFAQNEVVMIRCDAITTVGALSPGNVALVETSTDKWEIVRLQ